jgi:hypothetical protein
MAPRLICIVVQVPADSSESSATRGAPSADEALAKRVFTGLRDSITSLFRASKVARYASKKDRFMEAQSKASANDGGNEDDLAAHIGELFPRLGDPELAWLRLRLARACSMRLRYLSYCKSHQERIRLGTKTVVSEDFSDARSTATTALPLDQRDIDSALRDTGADGAESVLSYRTETRNDIRFKILGLDEFLQDPDKREHKCPYCQVPQLIDRSKSEEEIARLWLRHVYDDIKPYVCTTETCTVKMFGDNRLWLKHQCSEHLTRWQCQYCDDSDQFESYPDFETHMRKRHSVSSDGDNLQRWARISEVTPTRVPMTACPLCDWTQFYAARLDTDKSHRKNTSGSRESVSLDRYRRHVGSHLEQIALGMLPEDCRVELEDDSNSDGEEETSLVDYFPDDVTRLSDKWTVNPETEHHLAEALKAQKRTDNLAAMMKSLGYLPGTSIRQIASGAPPPFNAQDAAYAAAHEREGRPNIGAPIETSAKVEDAQTTIADKIEKPTTAPAPSASQPKKTGSTALDHFHDSADAFKQFANSERLRLRASQEAKGVTIQRPTRSVSADKIYALPVNEGPPPGYIRREREAEELDLENKRERNMKSQGKKVDDDDTHAMFASVQNPTRSPSSKVNASGSAAYRKPRPVLMPIFQEGDRVQMSVEDDHRTMMKSFVIMNRSSKVNGGWLHRLKTLDGVLHEGGAFFPEEALRFE